MASFGDYNRVNTNVTAMDARLSLNKINKQLGDSRLKLSTGFKLNNAEDDAAGFAIATKLKSRVAGLEQGLQNVSDAKSVLDVAEGAYNTVVDNLIEMKSLATQAANGTIAVGSDEMKYIASQLEALAKDINDISESTTYNGIDLMDSAQSLTFQVGEGTDDTMAVALKKVNMSSLFATAGTDASISIAETLGDDTNGGTSDDYAYTGSDPSSTTSGFHLYSAIDSNLADNGTAGTTYTDEITTQSGAIADANTVTAGLQVDVVTTLGDGQIAASTVSNTASSGVSAGDQVTVAKPALGSTATAVGTSYDFGQVEVYNSSTSQYEVYNSTSEADTALGVTGSVDEITTQSGAISDTNSVTAGLQVDVVTTLGDGQIAASTVTTATGVTAGDQVTVAVPATGSNASAVGTSYDFSGTEVYNSSTSQYDVYTATDTSTGTLENTLTGVAGSTILVREDDSTANSSLLFIDEDNVNHADMNAFIGHIDTAINTMNDNLNQIGIDQRSLSGKEVNLSEAITSNSAARSRIMDTDFAKEQSNSIRLQILQQTATAALSQANMGPQAVLSFLG